MPPVSELAALMRVDRGQAAAATSRSEQSVRLFSSARETDERADAGACVCIAC